MNRVRKPRFDRHVEYVAIGYPRKTVNSNYKLGEIVDMPIHRKRSLFRKKKIGPKDHPWTEVMLSLKRKREADFRKLSEKQVEEARNLGPAEVMNLETGIETGDLKPVEQVETKVVDPKDKDTEPQDSESGKAKSKPNSKKVTGRGKSNKNTASAKNSTADNG